MFCELAGSGRPLPRLTIDQSHNIEAKVEAMVMSVVNIQDAYARALIVDRAALAAAGAEGDVLGGHQVLLDAYNTDVRPLCASARAALGAADDPVRRAARVRALRAHRRRARRQRGSAMSATTDLIATADDLWPARRRRARRRRSTTSCARRTCSAPTARSRTSAAATRPPRAPRSTTRASSAR